MKPGVHMQPDTDGYMKQVWFEAEEADTELKWFEVQRSFFSVSIFLLWGSVTLQAKQDLVFLSLVAKERAEMSRVNNIEVVA